jgi:anti-sigma-K factor RskA
MDERIEALFPFYVLNAITDAERAEVEAYLAANPGARTRLEEAQRASAALPYAVAPVEPPARVKQALMARVHADVAARASAPRPAIKLGWLDRLFPRPLALGLSAVSLLVAVFAGSWAYSVNQEVGRLRQETTALRQEIATQQAELDKQKLVLAGLTWPDSEIIAIQGNEHQPQARGRLVAEPAASSAILVVNGLEPLAAGQTYQFWFIKGQQVVPAEVFAVDPDGQAVVQVNATAPVGSYEAVGVSIEPEGGSLTPTTVVMLGSMS